MKLELWNDYDREAIHDIFSPDTAFTPQAGTWGLWGIVGVPDRPGDYVLMVTYGQSQGEHTFEEAITDNGVLTWQSQPRQNFQSSAIQDLMSHDEDVNSIYLFLRTTHARDYTFLGPLRYLTHDAVRENPVYFQWQILEWPIPSEVRARMRLDLEESSEHAQGDSEGEKSAGLTLTGKPAPPNRRGSRTESFRGGKRSHNPDADARNHILGAAGEKLVLEYERRSLIEAGRSDLADRVVHVSQEEGDGAGYDIRSFTSNEELKYIEVKTTSGSGQTDFFMSTNELKFSQVHSENYYLYRVYGCSPDRATASFYVQRGPVDSSFVMAPTHFRVKLSDSSEKS
ncbi:DUF3427 domain-containing protein [Actinomycetota bacterium]|nr:DUF3427 domain-containing protein [Actinomycetota bacterium]